MRHFMTSNLLDEVEVNGKTSTLVLVDVVVVDEDEVVVVLAVHINVRNSHTLKYLKITKSLT